MISRRSALIMLLGAALSGEACAQNLTPRGDSTSNALALRVVQLAAGSDPNVLALMASYGKGDDETKFVIELQNESHGLFRHVPGSHPVRFLEELKRALVASSARLSDENQETLLFDAVFLGPPTIRSPGGGYGGAPGDWYTTKLFLGQDQSEVYFNFNLISGEAEFAVKDEAYGNAIISELSKVIW